MYEVIKIQGGFAVADWNGVAVVAYKSRKHAEQYARGATAEIFNAAELDNDRRDADLAYVAERAQRPVVVDTQLSMVF